MRTAFQPNAFQNNAFQIEITPERPGKIRKKPIITQIIINGRILEYEKKHIEKIKALLLLQGKISTKDADYIEKIKVKIKGKKDIDIEELLLILGLDE